MTETQKKVLAMTIEELTKEAELIIKKQSKLSAMERHLIMIRAANLVVKGKL